MVFFGGRCRTPPSCSSLGHRSWVRSWVVSQWTFGITVTGGAGHPVGITQSLETAIMEPSAVDPSGDDVLEHDAE